MDTDVFWKGSNAVDTARTWIGLFSWIAIIAGILVIVFGEMEFEAFLIGCTIIGAGISGFIFKGILRGFETIVRASEAYLQDRQELKDKAAEIDE